MSEHRTARRVQTGVGNCFTSLCRRLPGMSSYSTTLSSDSQLKPFIEFEVSLLECLRSLKSEGKDGILRLDWLQRALTVVLDKYKEAESLIPKLQFSFLECEENWMNAYLDDTTRILDVCNALTASISVLEHSQLFIRYASHMLERPAELLRPEDIARARSSLIEWLTATVSENGDTSFKMKKEAWGTLLQSLNDGLKSPKEKVSPKDKGFLYAIYGAKTAIVLVCSVLAMALSRGDDMLAFKLCLSDQFLWSLYMMDLLDQAKEESYGYISRGSVTRIFELEDVHKSVMKLLMVLDMMLQHNCSLPEELASSLHDLHIHMNAFSKGIDKLGKKINEFFHAIVHSRSVLLDHIAGSLDAVIR